MNKSFFTLALSIAAILSLTILSYGAGKKYDYNLSDPVSVVRAAGKMLMNSDYEEMINITEMNEKKRTIDTVAQMTTNQGTRELVKKESEKINSFELLRIESFTNNTTNQLAVVYTRWMIKITANSPRNAANFVRMQDDPGTKRIKSESDVYVDYLLKNFNGEWKIISRKTR